MNEFVQIAQAAGPVVFSRPPAQQPVVLQRLPGQLVDFRQILDADISFIRIGDALQMIFAEGGEIIVQNFFLGDSRSSVIRVGEARFLSIDEFTAIADVQVADDIQTTAGQTSNLAASLAQSPGSGQNFQNTEIGDLDGGTDTLELLGTSNAGGGGSEPDGVAELADNIGATATADVTITVTGSNDAPVVDVEPSSETVQVAEDGMLAMSGVAVSDPDSPLVEVSLAVQHGTLALGLPLAGVVITAGANGSAAVTILGSATDVTAALSGLSYVPSADFNGPDSLEIAVSDLGLPGTGTPLTDTAVIAIDVTPANDDPAAVDDTLSSVAEDSGTRIIDFADLLANDAAGPANEGGQALTIVGVSNAVGGVAVINGTTIEFTPAADFNGEASFDYTIRDDGQTGGANDFRTDSAHVSFDVTPVNDPAIVTGADTGSVTEDLTLTASGDLNHTDADNADDVWQAVAAGAASDGGYGTFSLTADGQWIYSLDNDDPAVQALKAGETLTDTFTVYTQDGTAKQVTVIVAGSNDAPVIEASSEVTGTVTESGVSAGTPVVTGLLTASDPDTGATQAWSGNAAGAYGAFVIDPAAGQWTYTLDEALADSLPESATVTETFTATVTDDLGATDTVDVTITVTGSNDAPTIEASSEVTGSVIESGVSAGTPVATGLLTATDPDTGASQSWSGDAAGSYGTFAVDAATGQWTYTLDEGLADSLAEGATVIETFTATVEDDFGATDTVDVTVTVTGSNDAPTIDVSSEVAGSVTESGVSAGTSVATGLLTASDPDAGATQSWSGDATGTFGTFAVNAATGLWTYTLDEGLANGLAEGQTVTETFSAIVTDDHGATDTVDVTVTVTGSNDAPMIEASSEATGSVIEGGVSVGSPVATGLLTASDPDAGATQAWSGDAAGAYGAFVIDPATGQWTYTLDEGLADSLAEGATATETFSVTVTDDLGATDTVDVTVRVTGSNDAPVIEASSEVTGTVTESGVSAGTPAATGLLTASDPDLGATQSWSGSGAGSYGTFTVDAVTGGWTYTLDAGLADSLAEGAPVTETFTATVEDDFGATDTVDVTITVTGSNDAPVIEASSEVTGSVTESGVSAGTSVATGLLTAADPDAGATQAWSGDAAGAYGAFVIDPAAGQWTYTLDEALADSLPESATVTETFTATVTDDLGATDIVDVRVTVAGSNDAPVIEASSEVTGSVIESGVSAGTPVATGLLTASDPDTGAAKSWSGDVTGSYGAFVIDPVTGRWTYTLDEGVADSLAEGATVTETFTATVEDDFGATDTVDVTITVTGSNDAPVIEVSSEVAGSVTESGVSAGTPAATGLLTASDPDAGATQAWSGNAAGSYGAFTVNAATGQWTYMLDEGLANGLAEGQTVTETFTATVTDDLGATDTVDVTVRVTGSNDAPLIDASSEVTGSVIESGVSAGSPVATGQLTATDPDAGATQAWSGSGAGSYGTFTVDAVTGRWTYSLNEGLADGLAEGVMVTETFTATVTDDLGATDTVDVTITVTGSNDAPAIDASSEVSGSVTESGIIAGNAVATGQLTASDPDTGATQSWSGDTTGSYGTFTVDPATGQWTYTLDEGLADSLAEDQLVTETFTATITDDRGATDTVAVTVTVTGSNDAPVVDVEPSSETVQVAEDGTLAMSGVAVSDPDSPLVEVSLAVQHGTLALGLPLAGVIITAGANGSAAVTILGSAMDVTAALSGLSYLPGADFNGPDSLEIAVSDLGLPGTGAPLTDTAVIAIDVTPANDDPAAGDDTLSSVAEDSGTRIIGFADLLANDAAGPANESGQSLTIVGVSNAVGGVAVLNGTTIEFTPSADFNGEASFDYTIRDDGQTGGADDFRTDSARVSFDVTPVNDPAIVTGADTGSVTEDLTLTASGDLNHTDADNADDVWQAVAAGAASDGGYGTFSLTADGQWIYSLDNDDPAVQALKAGETLTDTFTVYTQDGTGKQVTVTVHGADDVDEIAPTYFIGSAAGDRLSTAFDLTGLDFTKSLDPDIGNSETMPSVTVSAFGTPGEYEYYRIDIAEDGTRLVLDIDYAAASGISFDSYLYLLDGSGEIIDANDDAGAGMGGGGSVSDYDSYLSTTLDAGTYYIVVGRYHPRGGQRFNNNGTYELQVSLEAPGGDPIVLDLNGDGVDLSASAAFDIDADGTPDQIGWIGPEDGLLAMDLDGSGAIEDGSELFSEVFNGGSYADSLEALASLDDNNDGVIDARDTAFDRIVVWQDANTDGITQDGELFSISEHGIESVSLQAATVDIRTVDGNTVFAEGTYTSSDGGTGSYAGVAFGAQNDGEEVAEDTDDQPAELAAGTGPNLLLASVEDTGDVTPFAVKGNEDDEARVMTDGDDIVASAFGIGPLAGNCAGDACVLPFREKAGIVMDDAFDDDGSNIDLGTLLDGAFAPAANENGVILATRAVGGGKGGEIDLDGAGASHDGREGASMHDHASMGDTIRLVMDQDGGADPAVAAHVA